MYVGELGLKQNGFTLVEILIAMALVGALSIAVVSLLMQTNRGVSNAINRGGIAQVQGAARQAALSALSINKSANYEE